MDLKEEKLINIVSAYRELYDLQNEHYMNQSRKDNIWAEIAIEMGASAIICKERWKSLRDGYNRSLKRRKTKSGDGATTSKPWRYEKQMGFLQPFFQERQVKSNLMKSVSSEDDSNSTSNSLPNIENNVFKISSTPATTSSAMFANMTKRKIRKEVQQKSEVAGVLRKYLENRGNQAARASTNNPIHSFFTAMADTVVTFPPDNIQNISRPDSQCYVIENSTPPSRTRHLSSESELEYTDTLTQTQVDSPSPSTSMKSEKCLTGTSDCNTETMSNTSKRQYYITPDGLVVPWSDVKRRAAQHRSNAVPPLNMSEDSESPSSPMTDIHESLIEKIIISVQKRKEYTRKFKRIYP
ncbi:hypothetical protein ACJJTC_006817 [Scirpophaga incertulas]